MLHHDGCTLRATAWNMRQAHPPVPCRALTTAPMEGWEVRPEKESKHTSTRSAPAVQWRGVAVQLMCMARPGSICVGDVWVLKRVHMRVVREKSLRRMSKLASRPCREGRAFRYYLAMFSSITSSLTSHIHACMQTDDKTRTCAWQATIAGTDCRHRLQAHLRRRRRAGWPRRCRRSRGCGRGWARRGSACAARPPAAGGGSKASKHLAVSTASCSAMRAWLGESWPLTCGELAMTGAQATH